MKRKITPALLAMMVAPLLVACGSSDGEDSASGSGAGEPLKIALLPPRGGALAQLGKDATQGWEYAAAEANAQGGVAGHEVELVRGDTDGSPAATIRAARKAVTQQGAQYISGVISSPEHGALAQQLQSLNAVSLLGLGKDDELTGKGCNANAFRAVHSTSMEIDAFTEVLPELPAKRWAILAVDYSTGYAAAGNFKKAAKAAGLEVVSEQYAPLGTTDFGSYITKLEEAGAEGLFALVPSADGVAFIKQGSQFKLFDTYKTVFGFQMVSEPVFDALGDRILGFYSNLGYDVGADNAKNRAFVEGYTEQFGTAPYSVPADHYLAAQLLFEAVEKVKSIEPEQVKAAMNGLTFDSFAGEVTMGADHQLVRPAYVGQVVKQSGSLAFDVVAELPGKAIQPEPNPDCEL